MNMKLRSSFLFTLLIFFSLRGLGNELMITNSLLTYDKELSTYPILTFTLSWKNAWYNAKNHDAVWIFIKITDTKGKFWHSKIAAKGHEILYNHHIKSDLVMKVSDDKAGIFIQPNSSYRGDITCRLKVLLDTSLLLSQGLNLRHPKVIINVIEMVYIPASSFYIGDTDSLSRHHAAFYKVGLKNERMLYQLKKETEIIPVGKSAGDLFYEVKDKTTQGDQSGPVPSSFPKGVRDFYIMKYELTQGQYTNFLNCLDTASVSLRTINNEPGYYQNKGSIIKDSNSFKALSPTRSCNYISWDDAMAFADWSGLRPYTELEFSKAARGPAILKQRDFPWGNSSSNKLSRYINFEGDFAYDGLITESDLSDNNREVHGASYYWVMDLSGGLWERVVTIGDSTGRRFQGTVGDGILKNGYADNSDWPKGIDEKGFGFRGGGFYNHNRLYNIINPHSPVEYRPYGSWSGGKREMGYGSRFVRTAD